MQARVEKCKSQAGLSLVCRKRNRLEAGWAAPLPPSLPKELLVEEEDEKIDIDFGFVKELHDSHTLILQLQQVLGGKEQGGGLRASGSGAAYETLVTKPYSCQEHWPLKQGVESPLYK